MDEIVFDAEFDSLAPTKIHCLSARVNNKVTTVKEHKHVTSLFSNDNPNRKYIGHNIILYDEPAINRIVGTDTKDCDFIDTLAVSWYLYPKIKRHGLEYWGEKLGFPKVQIDDWENLSYEEYKQRCERDVEINYLLWEQMKSQLLKMYGSMKHVYRVCSYLTFKLKCARLAEESRWKIDVPHIKKSIEALEELTSPKLEILKAVMPKVVKKNKRSRPKNLRKKDFSLTKAGERWYNDCKEQGLEPETTEEITCISHYEEPNPSSHQQVKEWLFSLGWEPQTFKTNDKGNEVPQLIKLDKSGLCESILNIDNEAVKELDGLFTINHRISTLNGFLKNQEDGFVKAQVSGFTNTLRFKHTTVVNLPSMGSNYGEYIRPSLVAREGKLLCGSDMSGLEDRTKQHYMVPYDPEYVEEMNVEGFDPHLDIAVLANMMTQEEVDYYKSGQGGPDMKRLKLVRHGAKTTNYSCTYGAYPKKIAVSANIPLDEATILWNIYWQRNWAIEEIAKSCTVREFDGQKWLWNPVAEMWYSLRYEKDRFSTLNQGTGSFCFDMWVAFIIKERPQLTGQFHDEVILEIKPEEKDEVTSILKRSINKVNDFLELRRKLDVDVQFGENYGQIH